MIKKIVLIFFLPFFLFSKLDNATILLSYPCSGNHLTRFIIEYLSGRPSGTNFGIACDNDGFIAFRPFKDPTLLQHVDIALPPLTYKAHTVYSINHHCNSVSKLILIVRSFKECIASYAIKKEKQSGVENRRGYADLIEYVHYMDLIEYFHNFKGKKMLIYYEDLLQNPAEQAIKIFNFLSLTDKKRLNYFCKNAEIIIAKSKQIITNKKAKVDTYCYKNRSGSNLTFYQSLLDQSLIEKRQNYIKKVWKDTPFLRYISHYF